MSFGSTISKYVDELIGEYVKKISVRYSLDYNELLSLWREKSSPEIKSSVDMTDLSPERLSKCSAVELKALCKSNGCKCVGKKDELLERLLGHSKNQGIIETPKKKSPNTIKKLKEAPIIKTIRDKVSVIALRENAFKNLEHPATRFVFDKVSQKVIGKQEDDGTVSDLKKEDIDTCNKYKFNYKLPENLDDDDGGVVEELEEDSDIQINIASSSDEEVEGDDSDADD